MSLTGSFDGCRRTVLLAGCAGLLTCCFLTGCADMAGNSYSPTGSVTGRNSTSTPTSTPHSDSDPGDRKLHMLAADPVMADLPAGLTKTEEKRVPGHYETPVFGSGGSFGASVSVTFTSAASLPDIYKMIGDSAVRNGWVGTAVGSTNMNDRWAKTYPEGSESVLLLTCKNLSATTSKRSCTLDGGI